MSRALRLFARGMRWLGGAIIRHGGAKFAALVIALVFFVVTRDDVTRTFTIPLQVTQDPNRVLLTKLPDHITVELHGSWARMSRLREHELGPAALNLSDARPGPLSVEPASIVMPEGVIFRSMQYEKVDLRFDGVIERPVTVRAELRGAVNPDYEHTRTTIEPPRWRIRGGGGPVSEVHVLNTEPIVLDDITADTTVEVALQRPSQNVEFTATPPGEEPQVKVTLAVRPRLGERRLSAAVTWPPDQVAPPELPTEVSAIVRGGLPDLRIVDAALSPPLVAMPRREKPSADFPGGSVVFVVQFTPAVPPEVQARLSVEAALDRVVLAAPVEETPPAR
ncbi:MAG: YbbR-like domain-containing protein [Nannocystis sp.]|nr:YbbR-like domain-containing protein [Nannocystis sp.]MBA3548703.1 YbbR-like domain-containing protein [Nannocystis sp.]